MRVPYVVAFGLVSAFAPGVIATDQPPLVVAGQTVLVPSGNLRLKAFLWKPNGPGPFPAVLFCHGSGGADAGHTGRAPDDGSCRETCARVSETWLCIHVSILPRTRSFSRPSHVHTGHLAARGGVKGKRSSSALAVRPSYHRSARRCDGSSVIPQNCACSRCEVYCDQGHSFGGQLTLLAAERDHTIRAAVTFAAAACSWEHSPELRERLRAAADNATSSDHADSGR